MIQVDTVTLTSLINTCFTLSATAEVKPDQRRAFLVAGKQLRGSLVHLLSAQFEEGTPAVLAANQQLLQANQQAEQLIKGLGQAAQIVKQIDNLVGGLDKLLPLAARFV